VAVSWFVTLTFTPLLGSLITEPAAMTIGALLLAQQFYHLQPSVRLKYATLALLFVNVSIGGALTHFAAPPIVMVAQRWGWTTADVFQQFGLASLAAILISNTLAYFVFRKELSSLAMSDQSQVGESKPSVPFWILGVHLAFMAWTVYMLVLHQARWMGLGLSAYVAFHAITYRWQNPISFRSPLLVGFFLAGLVVLGGQQSWWISPVLVRMDETSLLFASVVLTSFNDNAAITYLASQVPALAEGGEISAGLRHAVMAGALAGGGLTVIANAPNPAGQAILGRHFAGGISPWRLFLWAIIPTLIALLAYSVAR
jgi:Na+/H+ antiporter NhaD/arsenite permease-like protein